MGVPTNRVEKDRRHHEVFFLLSISLGSIDPQQLRFPRVPSCFKTLAISLSLKSIFCRVNAIFRLKILSSPPSPLAPTFMKAICSFIYRPQFTISPVLFKRLSGGGGGGIEKKVQEWVLVIFFLQGVDGSSDASRIFNVENSPIV